MLLILGFPLEEGCYWPVGQPEPQPSSASWLGWPGHWRRYPNGGKHILLISSTDLIDITICKIHSLCDDFENFLVKIL